MAATMGLGRVAGKRLMAVFVPLRRTGGCMRCGVNRLSGRARHDDDRLGGTAPVRCRITRLYGKSALLWLSATDGIRETHLDRSLWAESFPIGKFPRYPCPSCAIRGVKASLTVGAGTFVMETQSSLFHAFLRCDDCAHAVSVAGFVIDNSLFPKCFVPAVPLISNPGSQGGGTGKLVEQSFELFWVDPASCANCLRSFLERVLEDWSVPEGPLGRKWSLSERIDYFRHSVSVIEEEDRRLVYPIFKTLKKIGDLGSHAGDVSRENLLDAFEDMEIALGIIYGMENEPAVARIKANIRRNRRTG